MNQRARARGPVPVGNHSFYLLDSPTDGSPPLSPSLGLRFPNGLIAVEPGIATITTGIADGNVLAEVELHQTPPPPDLTGWDDVVEISVDSHHGNMRVGALDANLETEFPELTFDGPGPYRLRIHAQGRDVATDLVTIDPVENYLIQSWRNDVKPELIHKASDTYGQGVRRSARIGL